MPDLKLIFFCSDLDMQDKDSYLHIDKRGDNPWMCVPIPFWDIFAATGFLTEEDEASMTDPDTIDKLVNKASEIEDQILAYVSCVISSAISLNGTKPYEKDEDCDILEDKEQLKTFIESCESPFVDDCDSNYDSDYDDDESQIASDTIHKDIIEMANALECSCTALEHAMIKYGFYDDDTYQVITATIPPEEYVNSRKKAYFVNTGDIKPLFGKDWNATLKNIKVDKDFNPLEK